MIMWLIVGLGNPGLDYMFHRHNIGFLLVDKLHDAFGTSDFRKNKWNALMAEGKIGNDSVLFLKPQTYMNLSGPPVQAVANFYKIPMDHIIVIHDELDISVADIKMKQGGGNGGHNGLKSIDAHLGQNYYRMRIGIGRPTHKGEVSSYVLNNIPKVEVQTYIDLFDKIIEHFPLLLSTPLKTADFLNKVKG
jgi:PTH1 family peptidyl-tRNA hydrolase